MSPWKFTCVLVHVYTCLTFGDDVIDVLGNMVLDLAEFLRNDRLVIIFNVVYHMYVFYLRTDRSCYNIQCGVPHVKTYIWYPH